MNSPNYLLIQISFVFLSLIFVGWLIKEIFAAISISGFEEVKKKTLRIRILIGLFVWVALVSTISILKILQNFSSFPPPMMIMLAISVVTILIITFSGTLKEILRHIPPHHLIRIQVFRVFVEILLWMLFLAELMPVQTTFEGRNFDIVVGLTAPLIAYFFKENKKVMIVWNILGLGVLLNIVVVAILSLPLPFRYFMNEPSSAVVTYFPIVFLPALLVPLAYTLHFFSLRQLTGKKG